ncbi:hypothetical protein DFR70_104454 [Nocardia tenerifensis]|uniref:Uncharacterized protein n=1 Tax=Nocardia tenerifensis TaxID=228006 RepID=A0A318K3E6_9NOCA|nr:hypothetical protein [Nocardia tenerifensis]PXX65390.1 hypothetical protein DFR70_104454 [Nocardia tenerifensis]
MIYSTTLPAQAAGGADLIAVAGVYSQEFYSGDTVTDVEIVAPAGYSTVVGAATNNVTISVRQFRAGAVVSTFASLTTTTGVSLSAEGPVSVPITAQPILLPGDVIDVRLHQNGNGQALGAGLFVAVYVS